MPDTEGFVGLLPAGGSGSTTTPPLNIRLNCMDELKECVPVE